MDPELMHPPEASCQTVLPGPDSCTITVHDIADEPLAYSGSIEYPPGAITLEPSPAFVEQITNAVADRLMQRLAHPEALGLATDAASVPGLDRAACAILADWLEDRRLPGVAERVRKMAVQPGDLLVIETDERLSFEARHNLRTSAEAAVKHLGNVVILVLDGGMKLKHIPVGERKAS